MPVEVIMGGAIAESGAMSKSRGRPRKPTGEGTPVRVDSDLVTKARYLAAGRGVPVSELLSELLRPAIDREFRKAAKDLMEGQD